MLIAQISDLHFHLEGHHIDLIQPAQRLEAAVQALNTLSHPPDLVLVTGDLTENGLPEEYAEVGALLSGLHMPWLPIPGNHDNAENMREAFPEMRCLRRGGAFMHYVIDDFPIRIVALDTVVPGEDHGALCPARLEWLTEALDAETEKPTLIMMHHPPLDTGLRCMDQYALMEGRDVFADLIANYHNIERIVCGHMHRHIVGCLSRTVVTACPGIAHQTALELEGDPAYLAFRLEPPSYLLHWFGDNGLITHHAYVGDYGEAVKY